MRMERNYVPDTKFYYETSEETSTLNLTRVLQNTQHTTKWVVTVFNSWIENCKKILRYENYITWHHKPNKEMSIIFNS